jgi:hypothetical protein
MRARRMLPFVVALLSLAMTAGVATPAAAASSRADASSIIGIWHNTITCQGLVEAANMAQLRPLAPTVVVGYFPTLTPRQPSHGTDICCGQPLVLQP